MSSQPSDYEKKLIEMQFQLRENQSYLTDTFQDLDKWTQDIKEKEKKIIENPESLKTENKGLPPIRNLVTTKKKKKIKKPKENDKTNETKQKTKKLNSYDYRAWDKLDVDKMCQEVDEQKTSSSEYTTDEEWEEEQRRVKAEWEKERGNQFFKDNMLNEAINCYTKAIQLDPTNAVYPANRAMCLIKQEKYGAAEVDCSISIELDPKYAKAYHRRATARVKLGKNEEAKKDYESLLKLEPNSKLAQTELNKLIQTIEARNIVFAIDKKESERSKKPLKRIKIEEINDDSADRLEIEKNLQQINQKINLSLKEQDMFQVENTQKVSVIEEMKNLTLKEPLKESEEKIPKEKSDIKKDEAKPEEETQKKNNEKEKKIEIKETKPISVMKIPDAPTNGYQFKKDWQLLGNDIENLAKYFKKIPPVDYNKLFLNGLESDNLSKILLIFRNHFINDPEVDLFNCMKCLSQVKRFETQFMFLTSTDKKAVEDLITKLKLSSQVDQTELDNLIKLYKY